MDLCVSHKSVRREVALDARSTTEYRVYLVRVLCYDFVARYMTMRERISVCVNKEAIVIRPSKAYNRLLL